MDLILRAASWWVSQVTKAFTKLIDDWGKNIAWKKS